MVILGSLLYISVLLINAVAILSEDRFLARINLSPASYDPAFGQSADASVKAKIINLIASVRTLMRSASSPPLCGRLILFLKVPTAYAVSQADHVLVLLAVPLIVINTLIIAYELVLG